MSWWDRLWLALSVAAVALWAVSSIVEWRATIRRQRAFEALLRELMAERKDGGQ